MPSEMLLARAKEAIANNKPEDALLYLDEFLRVSLDNTDEAWFLRGQLYENPEKCEIYSLHENRIKPLSTPILRVHFGNKPVIEFCILINFSL